MLRLAYERETTDPEILRVFMRAVDDDRAAGATIVDPGVVEDLEQIRRPQGIGSSRGFKYDLNRYLASHGDRVPARASRRS